MMFVAAFDSTRVEPHIFLDPLLHADLHADFSSPKFSLTNRAHLPYHQVTNEVHTHLQGYLTRSPPHAGSTPRRADHKKCVENQCWQAEWQNGQTIMMSIFCSFLLIKASASP